MLLWDDERRVYLNPNSNTRETNSSESGDWRLRDYILVNLPNLTLHVFLEVPSFGLKDLNTLRDSLLCTATPSCHGPMRHDAAQFKANLEK